jgi:hypothetical protein
LKKITAISRQQIFNNLAGMCLDQGARPLQGNVNPAFAVVTLRLDGFEWFLEQVA